MGQYSPTISLLAKERTVGEYAPPRGPLFVGVRVLSTQHFMLIPRSDSQKVVFRISFRLMLLLHPQVLHLHFQLLNLRLLGVEFLH